MKIKRIRYGIRRKKTGELLCGRRRDYHFKTFENIGNDPVATYIDPKRALSSFKLSWRYAYNFDINDYEVIKVEEIIDIED